MSSKGMLVYLYKVGEEDVLFQDDPEDPGETETTTSLAAYREKPNTYGIDDAYADDLPGFLTRIERANLPREKEFPYKTIWKDGTKEVWSI